MTSTFLAGSAARQPHPLAAPQQFGSHAGDDAEGPGFAVFTASPAREQVEVTDMDFKAFMRTRGRRVSAEEFTSLMQELGARFQLASRPQAGRLVFVSWQPPGDAAQDAALRDYLAGCRPIDRCISLPGDTHSFGLEARHAVALDIALKSVWPGVVAALGGMMNLHQLKVMLVTSLVVYFALLAAPEPVSKEILQRYNAKQCKSAELYWPRRSLNWASRSPHREQSSTNWSRSGHRRNTSP